MAATIHHKETAVLDLGALLDAGDGALVTLVTGKTRLAAHRAVLAAGSPVYAAMFSHETLESSSGEVTIPDVEGPVLRQLLAYLYTRRTPQLPGMAPQLLTAADKYGVLTLKDACEQQLVDQLALENAAAAAVLSLKHSCHRLRLAAIAFVKDHMYEVMATRGWEEAVRSQPEVVIELTRLLAERAAKASDPAATAVKHVATAAAAAAAHPTSTVDISVTIHRPHTPPPDDVAVSRLRSLPREERGRRLIQAAKEGAAQEVRALLTAGVDVEAQDREMRWFTALHWAARRGQLEAARSLVQAGAELEARDSEYQQTPLQYAAANGHVAVMRLLLASSADINARSKNGCTALHIAADYGRSEAVAALLEAGADRAARDKRGKTALDWARESNHQHVIQLLQ